jgi:hypothetical protein
MNNPVTILESLRRKWVLHAWISYGIISLAIGITAGEILHRGFDFSLGWIVFFTPCSFILCLIFADSWRITLRDMARWLDAKYPSLEESTTLLLPDGPAKSGLQEMQAGKTGEMLGQAYQEKIIFPSKMKRALYLLLLALVLFTINEGIFHIPFSGKIKETTGGNQMADRGHPLPVISSMHIRITPPEYTRISSRQQEQADLLAEEGSVVDWDIKTDKPVNTLGFIFNDSGKIFLQPKNPEHTEWGFHKNIQRSGFYQLMIDSQISDHYKMEMIRDQFPEIEVESPKPKTILEYGMAEQIPLKVSIRDDYGIQSAGIYATISSGSGEAVKFSEKQIHFDAGFQEMQKRYVLQKNIDLNALGMVPGDELYFYIRARDNHGQEKRSGVFVVVLADTADLMSTDLSLSGLNVKPEYFRSERQIIIETQQLLQDKHRMPIDSFNNKSNDLGIDQKLLRLRYGKFLGEENESNEGIPDNQNGVSNPSAYGNASKLQDAYTDKHDNAEVAGFFEKDTKEQLKATLTEMWNAESQLRIYKPEAALPFEYKALRLLKDLQQKSRVYVAKAGYKTTPLDFGKRLSGDQDKIGSPVEAGTVTPNKETNNGLREALGSLQTIKSNPKQESGMANLPEAETILREKAMAEPSRYLAAYTAIQKIIRAVKTRTDPEDADLRLVENALQDLIKPITETPSRPETGEGEALSDYYFRNLKKTP